MKLLIASDIHGDIESAEILIEAFKKNNCDKIVLLGDILYHGPRNNLPGRYAPKEVIELLNKYSDKILAVRGNCDTEVDQMVLEFPILADYAILSLDGLTVYATHGHNYNTKTPPPLAAGDILLHGHTHHNGGEIRQRKHLYQPRFDHSAEGGLPPFLHRLREQKIRLLQH